jgi:hypothetical protein
MSYLGNAPALAYTSFVKQDFTVTATTSYSLDHPVANANEIALFINFVRQEPTASYSASGTTLTLTEATSSSDDMYCVFLGKAVQTVNPPNGSVGTAQLVDDAVTKDKTSNLMYPAFHVYLSTSDQIVSDNVMTKVEFNTEDIDTDNCWDTTNYKFTPTVAGKYYIYSAIRVDEGTADLSKLTIRVVKNGSIYSPIGDTATDFRNNGGTDTNTWTFGIVSMNGSTDYLEIHAQADSVSGSNSELKSNGTYFGAYRIGD